LDICGGLQQVYLWPRSRRNQQTYSPIAKAAEITGDIKAQVTIDINGDVADAKILKGHKLNLLNDCFLPRAARKDSQARSS
jgi:outer membrane biosynthesis protein TonB